MNGKKTVMLLLVLLAALLPTLSGCGSERAESGTAEVRETSGSEAVTDAEALSGGETAFSGLGSGKLMSVSLQVCEEQGGSVSEDEKFGAALLNMSQEEFEAIGFSLGDSVDIYFGNGYSLSDVPYFNGYYVRNGQPVVVAYPGDPYVRITLNNLGIWDSAGLSEGDSVLITLRESGKYLAVQESLGQAYSFERSAYDSDEEFSNFRALSGGSLKQNFLYRGASPVDNSRGRASVTDALLKKAGIGFIVDLADSEEDMEAYLASDGFASAWSASLYDAGNMVLLDMGSGYTSQTYKEKTAAGLRAALGSEGPVYIHCMEGKDRTGFVCMLLEALAHASFEEMKADYMLTYTNYYRITEEGTPEKYEAIADLYFVPFLEFLYGTENREVLSRADFSEAAKDYLREGGMTEEELERLVTLITEP